VAPWAVVCRTLPVVTTSLWFLLFCGAATLAPATGAMLASAPRDLRALASACSTLCSNLLGYALSSFLSGCAMALAPWDRRAVLTLGMSLVIGWSGVALACFLSGLRAALGDMAAIEAQGKASREGLANGEPGSPGQLKASP